MAALLFTLASRPAAATDSVTSEVREFIDEMHRDYEFDREQLTKLLAQAEKKQSILDAISRPAERVVPWHEYRLQFATERRVREGVAFRRAHEARLASIDDAELADVVVGILGVETFYGRITGKFRVIDALTTLAFHYPPRADFFRDELRQFLLLTREEAVDPLTALGSYAGAMGSPQFISSSYRKYAVDADGDGRTERDPVAQPTQELHLVLLELHPGAATVAESAARECVPDVLRGDVDAGGQSLEHRHECGTVGLTGGQPSQHGTILPRASQAPGRAPANRNGATIRLSSALR